MAVIAALLMAVSAYGGNPTYSGSGDVSIRSYDRIVLITLDTTGDGSPDRAFVAGIAKALDKPLDLHWPHVSCELKEGSLVITDSANHRAFVAAKDELSDLPAELAVTRITHVIGIAHYWDLKPDFNLESLTKNW